MIERVKPIEEPKQDVLNASGGSCSCSCSCSCSSADHAQELARDGSQTQSYEELELSGG